VSTTIDVDDDSPVHPGEHHDHGPSDATYFKVFWVLVAITALEVSTYFWDEWFGEGSWSFAVPLLLIMMVVKFVLIASVFMHLRFDSRMLTRIFYFGLGLACLVYVAALSVMNIWTDNGNPWFNDPPPAVTPTTVVEGGAGG
jgi:cytochrome c oxidase subunit 4